MYRLAGTVGTLKYNNLEWIGERPFSRPKSIGIHPEDCVEFDGSIEEAILHNELNG